LCISPTARLDEVKHAYRILAKKYHPDVSKEDDSSVRFLDIKEAYDTLSNSRKREIYDREYYKQFGEKGYSKELFKSNIFNTLPEEFGYLINQIRELALTKPSEIAPETLNEKIIGFQPILSKIKISDVDYEFYLELSSVIARVSLGISEEIINEILDNLLISPDDKLIKYSSINRMQGTLSWVESIQENIVDPLRTYELDAQTKGFYNLKVSFYSELNKNLKEAISKSGEDDGHCYIATHIYGDYNSRQVLVLRRFRDDFLNLSFLGRKFIVIYYKISPSLVSLLGKYSIFNLSVRKFLNFLVFCIKKKYLSKYGVTNK
jgi:curved DNA-binding protein CbpA